VTDLINTFCKVNIILNHCSRSGQHRLVVEQYLADQNCSDCDNECRCELPVEYDHEAEAAYKVWQESLAYLQQR